MIHRQISITITAAAAIALIAAIILLRHPPPDPQISWGQGFQWGDSKFGERR